MRSQPDHWVAFLRPRVHPHLSTRCATGPSFAIASRRPRGAQIAAVRAAPELGGRDIRQADLSSEHAEAARLPVYPRNYLRPCLLLLLGEEPTYGYELRDKLTRLSLAHCDPGTVYRTLNVLEDDGLVQSTWERSAEGRRRRRYEITPAGSHLLDAWARDLCGMRDTIVDFIDRYEANHGGQETVPGPSHGRIPRARGAEASRVPEGARPITNRKA
ncbi:MAG: helix-turn-helix transcriptional regulator [Candidatus Dormibacter sp.]